MFRRFALTSAAIVLAATPVAAQDFSRWVDVQTLNVAARYKGVEDEEKSRTTHDVQDNIAIKARFKADPDGRVTVNVGAFTGGSFTGSWNNTGWGSGQHAGTTSVRQLFLAVEIAKGVEAQVGSLYGEAGEATEITALDNDAYITGERLTVARPAQLYFDEIVVTHGYVGDLKTPSFFDRTGRFDESNVVQVGVGKKIGSRTAASAEWSDEDGTTAWRGAVAVKLPRVVDGVRVELYRRAGHEGATGGAVSVNRKVARRIALSGGYANIDRAVQLNGDKYSRGSRLFGGATVPVAGPLSASVFYTHAIANDYPVPNARRFDAVLSWNVLSTLQGFAR
jgi:hypothetical protein